MAARADQFLDARCQRELPIGNGGSMVAASFVVWQGASSDQALHTRPGSHTDLFSYFASAAFIASNPTNSLNWSKLIIREAALP